MCDSFLFFLVLLLSACVDSYWLPAKASMSTKKEMVRNTTALLDQLLKGYDKRLRPGFGGKERKRRERKMKEE